MDAMMRYFTFVVMSGDYLNDWLTHLPAWVQPTVEGLGKCIALVVGKF